MTRKRKPSGKHKRTIWIPNDGASGRIISHDNQYTMRIDLSTGGIYVCTVHAFSFRNWNERLSREYYEDVNIKRTDFHKRIHREANDSFMDAHIDALRYSDVEPISWIEVDSNYDHLTPFEWENQMGRYHPDDPILLLEEGTQ